MDYLLIIAIIVVIALVAVLIIQQNKVKAIINDVEKDTYYSTIYLQSPNGEEVKIDSRPSDAIAVAIRVEAPIFVSAKVLADGSVSCDNAKDEAESEEFRNFVQSIKPSDFERLLKDDKQSDQ